MEGRHNTKIMFLVHQAAETGRTIVCYSNAQKKRIMKVAEEMGLRIPEPTALEDMKGLKKRDGLNADTIIVDELQGGYQMKDEVKQEIKRILKCMECDMVEAEVDTQEAMAQIILIVEEAIK